MRSALAFRQRLELRAAGLITLLPPRLQVRLSGQPPIERDGQRLEPELQLMLSLIERRGRPPYGSLSLPEAREEMRRGAIVGARPAARLVAGVRDIEITGAAGPLPARHYAPIPTGRPQPLILFFHGGGFVLGDLETHDVPCRLLAHHAGAHVVAVDYREAPEHRFPAAHEDALAAYRWALANAASIKGDPAKVALAGESAGGNLAVATAIAARDAKLQMPAAVVAVYPVAQSDTTTASYTTYAAAKPLDRPMIGWFLKNTLTDPAQAKDPRLSLTTAKLAGLPPVTIINAEIDPLRDDGAMLESALKAANVSVERKLYDGVTHEFFGLGAVLDKARDANQYAGDRLKQAFGR